MSDAFSSSSENVIQRVVHVTGKINAPQGELEELYQIRKTCDFINEHQFERVRIHIFYVYSRNCILTLVCILKATQLLFKKM